MPTAAVNGREVHYEEAGRGVPLVLLHGFPFDGRMWRGQLAGLADAARVIVPDLRGFGRTPVGLPFSLADLAEDVVGLRESLGLGRIVLGGLSMGGYVALAYARAYPASLAGMVLLDTKAAADTADAKAARDASIELVRKSGSSALADQMLPKVLSPATLEDRPEVVAAARAMMEACPVTTVEHAQRAMRDRPDHTDALPSIAVPTLLMFGAEDALTPPALGRAMAAAIPRAELTTIPAAGHLAPLEQPDRVNAALRAFLRSIADNPAAPRSSRARERS